MAPEARVAWDGLQDGRWEHEVARQGPVPRSRVGKNKIVVKRRGVADGLLRGGPADRYRDLRLGALAALRVGLP